MINLHLQVVRDIRDSWQLTILSDDLAELEFKLKRYGDEYGMVWLPELDDFLLASLAKGHTIDLPPQFPGGAFPRFLSGLWSSIFAADGTLLDRPCIESIRAIRQISRFQKKVFEVCSDKHIETAVQQFKATDSGLPLSLNLPDVATVSAVLHGRDLFRLAYSELEGSHGPGATAERLDSVARWDFPSVSRSIAARLYPWDLFPERYDEDFTVPIVDAVGRLESVPKTFIKPRLISIEPAASIFVQKGLLAHLDKWMCTVPQINMRDQSRNRDLARRGSQDGSLATIDLSEASDRVSLALVEQVFAHSKSFLSLIADLRTGAVTVDGCVFPLRKFASMGCALTFPVQMLVFRSLVIAAICRAEGDVSPAAIRRWGRSPDIGIFGDDIIIPSAFVQPVYDLFESVGLKINITKSFTSGPFRESCGGDYVSGVPVNPVYLRQRKPRSRRDDSRLASWAAMSHLLNEAMLPGAAEAASKVVQDILGPAPSGSGALSVSHPWRSRVRYNKALQRHESYALVPRASRKAVEASDSARLRFALNRVRGSGSLRSLVLQDKQQVDAYDPLGLTHHGRPTRAIITRRWVGQH